MEKLTLNKQDYNPSEFSEIIPENLDCVNVFVYGTLMTGESNHHYMDGSRLVDTAVAEGFAMYDVGYYPAIVPGNGRVKGELYSVPVEKLEEMDQLEGEGYLYLRKSVEVTLDSGEKTYALVYVYNMSVDGMARIYEAMQPYTAKWKETADCVWYVSYGSNMLRERFMCYIKGGAYKDGGADHAACADTAEPMDVMTYSIPYNMYFGNSSGNWEYGGVSFLDVTGPGEALGVAYLITREQFEHVAAQENGGRTPNGNGDWYESIVSLGYVEGYEVVTITNDEVRPANQPCERYLRTLARGIREHYSDMSDEEIQEYLEMCQDRMW